jgi:type I restriction enzyme S subunit
MTGDELLDFVNTDLFPKLKNLNVGTNGNKRAFIVRSVFEDGYNYMKSGTLILQLAVQGKLVKQDPKDEPAAVLLEKIKAEQEQLVKAKIIKKAITCLQIAADERPYEIPGGWEWTRLGQISSNIHYGYTASADKLLRDIRLLRITDIQNGRVDWESVPGCIIEKKAVGQYALNPGDLLIARTGGTIGKTFLIETVPVKAVFASYLIRVIPSSKIYSLYLKYFAGSALYWQQLYEKCSGTGQPNVNATALKALMVPLPPLNEQKRIVAKVDQLMALCDDLEAQLIKGQAKSGKLLEAAVADLLAA